MIDGRYISLYYHVSFGIEDGFCGYRGAFSIHLYTGVFRALLVSPFSFPSPENYRRI